MRIGIDVDGTLTNLVDSVIAFGQEYELENNLQGGVKNPHTDFYELAFSWGQEIGKKFWKQNFNKINDISPRPLVRKYLEKLRDKGHEIYIVTARNYEEFTDPVKSTTKWLNKHKIPYNKVIANASNKGQVCKDNNIEVFFDDLPKNCDSTSAAGVKTFMMHNISSYNYNNPDVKILYSFVEFYKEIVKLTEKESVNKTYVLNTSKKQYAKIKKGIKTVDLRLNDIRRTNIKTDDYIVFRLNNKPNKQLYAKVVDVRDFYSFKDLISYYGKSSCGFAKKSVDEANKIMLRFYTKEEVKKYGVVGIKFELMK